MHMSANSNSTSNSTSDLPPWLVQQDDPQDDDSHSSDDQTDDEHSHTALELAKWDARNNVRSDKPVRRSPNNTRQGIEKLRYNHDQMIDMIIMNPGMSNTELAKIFGYSAGWVNMLKGSDVFIERLKARSNELIDPTLRMSFDERFRAMLTRSMVVLQEKLADEPENIPDGLVLKVVEMCAKALGMGGDSPQVLAQVLPDHLDKLATRLVALQKKTVNQGVVIDVEAQSVETLPAG